MGLEPPVLDWEAASRLFCECFIWFGEFYLSCSGNIQTESQHISTLDLLLVFR